MITEEKLIELLRTGRTECYVRKSATYNPYKASKPYDWVFRLDVDNLVFTDSYRGFNPYGGVECVYEVGIAEPIWTCDYVGYAVSGSGADTGELYAFLKEARGLHLAAIHQPLFSGFQYERGLFRYETAFQGDLFALLQTETIFWNERQAALQLSSGRLRSLR